MALYVEAKWSKGCKSVVIGWRSSKSTVGQSAFAQWKCVNFIEDYKLCEWSKVMTYDNLCNEVENRPWASTRVKQAYERKIKQMSARAYCRKHIKQ
jgi:hypothetical protein